MPAQLDSLLWVLLCVAQHLHRRPCEAGSSHHQYTCVACLEDKFSGHNSHIKLETSPNQRPTREYAEQGIHVQTAAEHQGLKKINVLSKGKSMRRW